MGTGRTGGGAQPAAAATGRPGRMPVGTAGNGRRRAPVRRGRGRPRGSGTGPRPTTT